MRYIVVLAVLSCLLALCQAARRVTLKNAAGQVEVYNSNDNYCHRVGSKYHGSPNYAAVTGGPTNYFSDSECKNWVAIDNYASGGYIYVGSPIKAYRAVNYVHSTTPLYPPRR
ncbi:hypothetical protein GGI20_002998 [Coemansia sp. BCRC 34301]|nr:hypothetical protein GGI20_002998 [Coemansia sp. BCRC 34301]